MSIEGNFINGESGENVENGEEAARAREREEKRREKIAAEVTADFGRRREARRRVESGWLLNLNFYVGNQYFDIGADGVPAEEDKRFYWQSRRVFNHIAPTADSRLAKLTRLRPSLRVKPFSDEEGDVQAAKLATGALEYVRQRIRLDETVAKATLWSEMCGSVFYKIVWDEKGGRQVCVDGEGNPVFEGEVSVRAVPPFGIFPDRMDAEGIEDLQSLIHAEVVSAAEIRDRFGVSLDGREVDEPGLCGYGEPSGGRNPAFQTGGNRTARRDSEILIERYTRPTAAEKEGRLEIVAGGKLLYLGVLPYVNAERGGRGFPFVRQDCLRLAGAFFGGSVIDRLIPVQRAYNAVRNRKHEFLNRVAVGVLAVEDGSVDTDELADEGLAPGKLLVYRQGGTPPQLLDCGSIPGGFAAEEERLEKEFAAISGVSDLSQSSMPARVTSASGLQLLLSQDDSRMSATADNLAFALRECGKHILRLYKQFAGSARLMTAAGGDKKKQVRCFNAAELDAGDVIFETDETVSPADRRDTLLKLYGAGLLTNGEGKLSEETRARILEAFGFGGL